LSTLTIDLEKQNMIIDSGKVRVGCLLGWLIFFNNVIGHSPCKITLALHLGVCYYDNRITFLY
jgi:hypothetical protein